MSIHAYRAAWATPDMPPTTRLVLLALADHIGTDGWAWPSHDRLAAMCGIDRSNIKRHLRWLEQKGHIVVQRKPGWTNRYALSTQGATAPGRGGATAPGGRAHTPHRGGGSAPRTLRTVNNQEVCPHGTPTSGAAAGCPDCGTHLTLIGQP